MKCINTGCCISIDTTLQSLSCTNTTEFTETFLLGRRSVLKSKGFLYKSKNLTKDDKNFPFNKTKKKNLLNN